ncbi:MAG TPA: OmpA family protein [Chitinophaga sp.]
MQLFAKRIVPVLKTLLCLLPLQLAMAGAHAQYVYDYKHTADVYYNKSDYYSAALYYNKALTEKSVKNKEVIPYNAERASRSGSKKDKDYAEVVYKLAESYRKYNDFTSAEKWYAQAAGFKNNPYPLARFYYGVTLRANRKFDAAIQQFQQFRREYKENDDYGPRADMEIANCKFASEEAHRKPEFVVTRLGGNINAGGANYAPLAIDAHTLLFTSSRPDSQSLQKKKYPYINNLWKAQGSDSLYAGSVKVDVPASYGVDQGAASIAPDGKLMYLTRWSIINGIKTTRICAAKRSNNGWTEPVDLDANINVAGYNAMQPNVSTDGKYLSFVSNRPGGMGKNDIWYCEIHTDGTLGTARNMGTTINTREDDQAPYYNSEAKLLVFSTNGRVGLGGLDFFTSNGTFGSWTDPVNLGTPFNSVKDDVYFASKDPQNPLKAGFIASDRESVCCLELFSFLTTRKPKVNMLGGSIVDCDTHQPLSGVRVSLIDTVTNNVLQTQTVDESGLYLFTVEMKKRYKVLLERKDYFSKAIYSNTDTLAKIDSMYNPDICLKRYEVGKPVVLRDIYYDFDKATLRPESKPTLDSIVTIMADNRDINVEMSAHTDSKGKDAYNMKLSQARAQACVDYLVSKGVQANRLIARGYGKTRPIAPNTLPNGKDNPAGRQLNRRTEFKVLSTTVLLK